MNFNAYDGLRIAAASAFLLVCVPGRAEPPQRLLERASQAAATGDHATAERLASQALVSDERFAAAYYVRGRERFRQGKIQDSVRDFDRYVELRPAVASLQWERGIAYYYAGLYQKGAAQFELYQTKHDNDVENSVWRFLCMVPEHGIAKARSALLPIEGDRRVPMMQILEMYRGKLSPDEVLAAATQASPDSSELENRLFYAHLYIGLYYHAAGESEKAGRFIRLAADKKHQWRRGINTYMWDVARIHQQRTQRPR